MSNQSPTPTVSIIMPVYNGERFIAQAIQSVLAQTRQDWELIIADDGSTDNTASAISQFTDPRIMYFYQTNTGRSAARNRGMQSARGDFLLFLDADDWLLPECIQTHVTFLASHPDVGVSVSDGYFFGIDGETLATFSQRRSHVENGFVLDTLIINASTIGALHSAMLRREVIVTHGIRFDEQMDIGEDWDFFIQVARHAKFAFIPQVTCVYRWHPQNTTLSSGNGRRQKSLLHGRYKILNTDFFDMLTANTRSIFFYGMLMDILHDAPHERQRVLQTPQFARLPVASRVHLLRLVASDTILRGHDGGFAKRCLDQAAHLAPHDPIVALLRGTFSINPALCRSGLRLRRLARRLLHPPRPDPLLAYYAQKR